MYEHAEFDENNLPILERSVLAKSPFRTNTPKTMLVAFTGNAGSYWRTIEGKAAPPTQLHIFGGQESLIVPDGGAGWLAIELDLSGIPPGAYQLTFSIGSKRFADFSFQINH